ncbi:FAD:protein FMN transferase [Dictyobacter formicarum]|uniref:FAD:protein FMN transferase n=1 Tax=Dictyobacter formicarum TaxID=2778368 RepID=A0ABQ3VH76_9CHLR|nr:FAD:protein FMN transferase [Dictyobacter formicarum]
MALETIIRHNNLPFPVHMLPEPDYVLPSGMRRSQFHAMGTQVSFLLPEAQFTLGAEIIRTLFEHWEQTLSRFLPDSELSQLNRLAGKPVLVSKLLFTVLSSALEAARSTNGIYDPTLLNQLMQLGYDRTFEEVPPQSAASTAAIEPGGRWRAIQLQPSLRLVHMPAGTRVEFGGIAKGMAVDAALEALRSEKIETALVNAGGDLAVSGMPPGLQQWPIEIQGKTRTWVVPFHHGALATSGIGRRHWRQGTELRHHLLDPGTGLPARTQLWSVTVAAAQCKQAEVAAKVAFLLGIKQGSAFLRQHGLAALLIMQDGSVLTVGPWPQEVNKSEVQQC